MGKIMKAENNGLLMVAAEESCRLNSQVGGFKNGSGNG
jgi:hypothetical protein